MHIIIFVIFLWLISKVGFWFALVSLMVMSCLLAGVLIATPGVESGYSISTVGKIHWGLVGAKWLSDKLNEGTYPLMQEIYSKEQLNKVLKIVSNNLPNPNVDLKEYIMNTKVLYLDKKGFEKRFNVKFPE